MSANRAVVTGGSGFMGSHLCDALLADGWSVVAIDNMLTGRRANIDHLRNEPRFDFVEKDISEPFDVGKIDYIFHFASPASPVDYVQHGVATLRAGSLGTFNALNLAHKYAAKYLVASTSEIYGDPLEHPQRETYWGHVNPVGPRAVYDEAKRFSEAVSMAYHRYHRVDSYIARIFNTYGPRMQLNDGRVIANFIKQALQGDDLTVYGDGSQTRSFCYLSDAIDGILRLGRSSEHLPINIGNPEEFTILECAKEVLKITGSKSNIRHEPLPQDDPRQRRPDITRARQLLGWEPKINLAAGILLSLGYFKASLGHLVLNPTSGTRTKRARIFLCHASLDKQQVRNLRDRLRLEGIDCWLDEDNLLPGQDWQSEITKAVRLSDVVLVCLSRYAVSKEGFIQKEIRIALDAADEKPEGTVYIIPVRLDDCDVPSRLRRWHWVDLFEPSGFAKLISSLSRLAETRRS
jgi:dTDP-glucose 4,6-dehydratase